MTSARVIDWDEDVAADPGEDYDSLVRSLQYKRGFGLFFVCCTTENEEALIQKLQSDLTRKKIEILDLKEPITNLYSLVEERYNQQPIDILFVRGLAYSLLDYELQTFGKITENQYDDFTAIPAILNHLNQQRERFRDNLPLCYVFFLPRFALRYVIKRAPDFFDWRSGDWEFAIDAKLANNKAFWIYINGDFDRYKMLSLEQQRQEIIAIQDLLDTENLTDERRVYLLNEIGQLLIATSQFTLAHTQLQQAITIDPKNSNTYRYLGNALESLGRYEEAIDYYDRALKIKDDHETWCNKGNILAVLNLDKEAIDCYDRALKIKPDYYEALDKRGDLLRKLRESKQLDRRSKSKRLIEFTAHLYRGNELKDLGKYEEAILSYDRALEIDPDYHEAWVNRGNALVNLREYEKAIASYDRAIEINPNDFYVWNSRGYTLRMLEQYEEAIASFDRAIEINPNNFYAWDYRGYVLVKLEQYENAIASSDRAIEIKRNDPRTWDNRGYVLANLGRYEEGIKSHQKALVINPNYAIAYYNLACVYALQQNLPLALKNLQQAINFDSKYRDMAKTDNDFDPILDHPQFQTLLKN